MNNEAKHQLLGKRKQIGIFVLLPILLQSGCVSVETKEAPAPQAPVAQSDRAAPSQYARLAAEIAQKLTQQDKSRIAVVEFSTLDGRVTKLGEYIAETLTTELFNTGKFHVTERRLIDKVIEEQELSMSGLVSDQTYVKLGNLLGVNAITTGTVTDLGDSFEVNARVIDAETGAVISAANIKVAKTQNNAQMFAELSFSRRGGVTEGDVSREHGELVKQWATTLHGFSSQYDQAGWSAKQVLGEPNVSGCGDLRGAWTTESSGSQYVEVGFKDAVFPKRVVIRENNGVGFIEKLVAYGKDGEELEVEVDDMLTDCPGDATFSLESVQFPVNRLRVYANMDRTDEYENIDAILLEGFSPVQ